MAKKNQAVMMLEIMNESEPKKEETPVLTNHSGLVDQFLKASSQLETAEKDYKEMAMMVDVTARKEYARRGVEGGFSKSIDMTGSGDAKIKVTYSDKFKSIPATDELKKSTGGSFDKYFIQMRDIKLTQTDDSTVTELIKALGTERFQELFAVKLSYVPRADFDHDQFEAPLTVRSLAVQYAPTIKKVK